ncbi:hypothetical protein QNI19_36270 [Cytophagaceae bacterium DM2B3-1]|uniref:MucB/RseB N-terminal domain-containing protein n=1 Tax=Xanthocytophaga flava TaxID=3048013 RepID=A0ABT7CXF0_9BACT|nr:hypothetical protein [Xanthocytophaga flavus]MDJ1466766.1 hypothetical protein [Xanthocytophaga flavus]MDJ1498448.1 hypothetical protein [Xanthocytophaga flavus]
MRAFYTVILVFISALTYAQKANELTAQQIIDRSIQFCGGEKRIAALKTSNMTYILLQPDSSTAIINEKRTCGSKYVQSILSHTNQPQTTFYDGKEIAQVNGEKVIHVAMSNTVEEMKLKTYHHLPVGYKMLQYKLNRLPDKKFDSFDCYVVQATNSNGYTTINFFDKTNFRLLMVAYPNGNKSLFIDYVFKDEILFNSYIINTIEATAEKQIFQLRNLKLNIPIADQWFHCPYASSVEIPPFIKTGTFVSVDGDKTNFTRTNTVMEYTDEQGKVIKRRYLQWVTKDVFGLIDEEALKANTATPESLIRVRVVSWDETGYVCQWIMGEYTDTQSYIIVK